MFYLHLIFSYYLEIYFIRQKGLAVYNAGCFRSPSQKKETIEKNK